MVATVKRLLLILAAACVLAGCGATHVTVTVPNQPVLKSNRNHVTSTEVEEALPTKVVVGASKKTNEASFGTSTLVPAAVKAGGTKAAGKVPCVKSGETEFEWCATGALPEYLSGKQAASSSSGKAKLNLEKGQYFQVTITENTAIEFEHPPAGLEKDEVLVFFKENATGGFTVTFPGISWVGTEPTYSTAANAESLATVIIKEGKNTLPIGISGAEGKTGQEGERGPEGPAGTVKPWDSEQTFAATGAIKKGEVFPGFYVKLGPSSEKQRVVAVAYGLQKLSSGKATIKLQCRESGSATNKALKWESGSEEELEVSEFKTSSSTQEKMIHATTELVAKEYCWLETVTNEPTGAEGLSVTLFIEHEG
jgi:hypothetical protein